MPLPSAARHCLLPSRRLLPRVTPTAEAPAMSNPDAEMTSGDARVVLTRRRLLQGVGCLIAAAALPASRAVAQGEDSSAPNEGIDDAVMARLSAYMSEAASRALPPDAADATKHHILDS